MKRIISKKTAPKSKEVNYLLKDSALNKRIGTRISIGIERDLSKYIIRMDEADGRTK